MNHFLAGFGDELVKTAIAKKLLGLAVKHPLHSLGLGMTVGGTALAARQGYKRGRSGEQAESYLHAGYDPIARQAYVSPAATTNFNRLMKNKPTERELERIHGKYKEEAFRR